VGSQWFYRDSLVGTVCDDLLRQRFNSFYCKGPFGCGKSTFLFLVGRELSIRGCIVFLMNAKRVEDLKLILVNELVVQCRTKTCVLLVDEASNGDFTQDIWTNLLKEPMFHNITNLHILGFGVPAIARSSSYFRETKPLSYLLMAKNSADMDEIIDFWVNFVKSRSSNQESLESPTDRDLIAQICNWVCDYTNGHMYLIVSFCHYFFQMPEWRSKTDNYAGLFSSGEVYKEMNNIRHRCQLNDLPTSSYLAYLFGHIDSNDFIESVKVLQRLGYIDDVSMKFFSDYVLSCFQNQTKVALKRMTTWPENFGVAEKRRIGGLRHMKLIDFQIPIGGDGISTRPPVEDAVSQRWCFFVMNEFDDLYVSPQNRTLSAKGRVDFLFNGREKIAIEVALNGTRCVYLEKLDKFLATDGVYKEWRNSFAIFNIITDTVSRKSLDGVPAVNLKYLYEFNVQTNTLYRGDLTDPLLKPVSMFLPTP
jgi:hypothetical protein